MTIDYKYPIMCGLLLLLFAFLASSFWSEIPPGFFLLMYVAGTILLLYGSMKGLLKSKESTLEDERTKKLGYVALSYSRMITLLLLFSLWYIDSTNTIKLTVTQVIMSTIFIMLLTTFLFTCYFNIKGDVK